MWHVQVHVPDLVVAAVGEQHECRLLHEEHHRWGDAAKDVPRRRPRRIAPLPRHERDLAGQHFFVVALHLRAHPGLKNRIAQIGDAKGRLIGGVVRNVGIIRPRRDRAHLAVLRWQPLVAVQAVRVPGDPVVRGEVRDALGRALLLTSRSGWFPQREPETGGTDRDNGAERTRAVKVGHCAGGESSTEAASMARCCDVSRSGGVA
jgi:hypothetical protein